ncbi:unnamed protein product [Euphydryas editha]|uniref:Uncharacterized protein n=1 Tax=Euphydryas editha TaxID=104508 RepID=A0AAU9TYS3_EUPED|nr:unnamed protein product [Euphydryas editha]
MNTLKILIYILYFVSSTSCLRIVQNDVNTTNLNVTTLYPVDNVPYHKGDAHDYQKNRVKNENEKQISKTYFTVDTDDDNIQDYDIKENLDHSSELKDEEPKNKIQNIKEYKNSTREKENKRDKTKLLADTTSWTVNATYSKSKLDLNEDRNATNSNIDKEKSKGKEFKPSPHLGSFYDKDSFVIPTQATIGSFSPVVFKPSPELVSSPKDFFQLEYKRPANAYHDTIDTPYKFENLSPRIKDWKFESDLEAKPTEQSPTAIPAGGLYKFPDAFKEKPGTNGDGDDFGLDFKDSKDTSIKKRNNPWKKLLNFVTALIPVGIIISALTPGIITLENIDNNPHFPSRVSRRSDESVNELPPISEQCKRRLLCELHSDGNFIHNTPPHRPNLCYKIQCSDPQALSKLLRWLFNRNQRQRHAFHDRRDFIT